MDYEQDYIMRMIKQMVRVLFSLMLGKKYVEYELPAENDFTISDDTYVKIIQMADEGRINEAENFLYKNLDRSDKRYFEMGLAFYEHLNSFTDDFLETHDYCRQEILDGIENFAGEYGVSGMVSSVPLL